MSAEAVDKTGKKEGERPIQVLKRTSGRLTEEMKQYVKDQLHTKKAIRTALKPGAKTVPQIAAESNIDASVILWHLMAMRRYGEVTEAGEQGQYPLYALREDRA